MTSLMQPLRIGPLFATAKVVLGKFARLKWTRVKSLRRSGIESRPALSNS